MFLEAELALNQADVILHPRAQSYEFVGSMRKLYIVVEWTMKTRDNKQILWLTTIVASATEPFGNAFTVESHGKILYEKTFDDLTDKTISVMRESPEI